jgi:hypothetical protein
MTRWSEVFTSWRTVQSLTQLIVSVVPRVRSMLLDPLAEEKVEGTRSLASLLAPVSSYHIMCQTRLLNDS